jgi:hypothetical protein
VLISTGTVCLVGLLIGMAAATSPAPSPNESRQLLIASVTVRAGPQVGVAANAGNSLPSAGPMK